MGLNKIDIVIVTYNRLGKLKNAIDAFDKQTLKPSRIIVVNNNSKDGTMEFLTKWQEEKKDYEKIVLNLSENIGGSGGFFTGIEYALNNDADWIWVSDDDAYPDKNAIENATNYINKHNDSNLSAICGKVMVGSRIDYSHRRTIKKGILKIHEIDSKYKDYTKAEFEINLFSYVGTIMNANKIKKVGNVNKDLFIYYDDTDHSIRMNSVGKIICVPSIIINHDVVDKLNNGKYIWKNYYLFRNKLYFLKNNYGKRYSNFEKLFIYLRILKKHNYKCTKLILNSIHDFNCNKLGIHDVYKPGWGVEYK